MRTITRPGFFQPQLLALAVALGVAAPAKAVNFNIGEIEGQFDSSLSLGASWSTQSPHQDFIGYNNGGNIATHTTDDGRVNFEKGETFCFIMPIQDKPMEAFQPVIRSMNSNPDLRRQYDVWAEKRSEFNALIFKRDPEATKEAWQRFYFKGEYPEEIQAEAPSHHVNKRRMKSPKLGV